MNAKLWLNDQGVLEVWTLWAGYQDLDFEKDMPPGVRKLVKEGRPAQDSPETPRDEQLSITDEQARSGGLGLVRKRVRRP